MSSLLVVAALEEEVAELRRRHPRQAVLVTGPGKVLAAASLAASITAERPREVLVIGTAGALHPDLTGAHEVAVVAQHDFDGAAIRALVGRAYGEPILLSPRGPHLATGDVFVADPDHVARLAGAGFGLVDMEGYAYAHVCRSAAIRLRIVKAVSDGADGHAAQTWAANVDRCAVLLADWFDADQDADQDAGSSSG